jgi:hypothetical protein
VVKQGQEFLGEAGIDWMEIAAVASWRVQAYSSQSNAALLPEARMSIIIETRAGVIT